MATYFDPTYFDPLYFDTGSSPVVDDHHGGLLLDPPPGWQAISPNRPAPRQHGPLYPDKVLTTIDFNRDDLDELWLLGLDDLETN